ncbi:transmembrane protein 25 isoform X2 [Hyperolius riggenbachi]|uniref:transmembrane protein 25 isoform X2 n=1 Tax=Hyperolius riggenbachi TaxID=752182 RepID=UPI0035A36E84
MFQCISLLLFWLFFQNGLGDKYAENEIHGMPCEARESPLAWYLNGVKQEVIRGKGPPFMLPVPPGSSSTLSLAENLGENCNKTENREEVLLQLHFPPESPIMPSSTSGLSVVLILMIQTQPPPAFTLQDQSGQFLLNSSHVMLLDTRIAEANENLQVKVNTEHMRFSPAPANAEGLLSTRLELSVFSLVVATSALVVGILLINVAAWYFTLKRRRRHKYGAGIQMTLSASNNMKLKNNCLPREHLSLPSNLQLNDLRTHTKGFEQFPLVGYIYKASSMSSDEIWL